MLDPEDSDRQIFAAHIGPDALDQPVLLPEETAARIALHVVRYPRHQHHVENPCWILWLGRWRRTGNREDRGRRFCSLDHMDTNVLTDQHAKLPPVICWLDEVSHPSLKQRGQWDLRLVLADCGSEHHRVALPRRISNHIADVHLRLICNAHGGPVAQEIVFGVVVDCCWG